MISLSDAGGRMMYSYKELAELAGYTSRVYNLLSVLHSLHSDEFQSAKNAEGEFTLDKIKGKISEDYNGIKFEHAPIVTPAPGSDRGGEILVKDLNITVQPGEHLLITGPNGVGKTAIARVIAGLWPLFCKYSNHISISLVRCFVSDRSVAAGSLSKPDIEDIFYIPQRPYLSLGTLRDQ